MKLTLLKERQTLSLKNWIRFTAMGVTLFTSLIVMAVVAPASFAGEETIYCDGNLGVDVCSGDWLADSGAEQESGVVGTTNATESPTGVLEPGCWDWSPTVVSRHPNPLKRWEQWRYWNHVSWCFNGVGDITYKSYGPGASVTPGWMYQGTVNQRETGGVGSPAWTVFVQGDFQACFSKWGCIYQRLPYIEVKVNGMGAYSSSRGW